MSDSWADILETDEYLTDVALIKKIMTNGIALEDAIDRDHVFIDVFSHLLAGLRYRTRHMVEQQDIDLTDYLDRHLMQTGVGLPDTEKFPVLELLRENKHWFGSKGTERIYQFISKIIGSEIEVYYPRDLIFRFDHPRSKLSGAVSATGKLPFDESCLAYFRDGIYWAKYTYVVNVKHAELIDDLNDFRKLIRDIHPAGTKRFVQLNFNMLNDSWSKVEQSTRFYSECHQFWWIKTQYPTLSNSWILSGGRAKYSMKGGHSYNLGLDFKVIPALKMVASYKQLKQSNLTTRKLAGRDHTSLVRFVANGDGTYTTLYPDEDSLLLTNQQTNMGMSVYDWSEVENLTWREVANIAWDNDLKNPDNQEWDNSMLYSILETV